MKKNARFYIMLSFDLWAEIVGKEVSRVHRVILRVNELAGNWKILCPYDALYLSSKNENFTQDGYDCININQCCVLEE